MLKKTLTVLMASTSLQAFADENSIGLAKCMSIATKVALIAHAQHHPMIPIPKVQVEESDRSASNGIDLKVTVNGSNVYYITASPIGGGPDMPIKGCSKAYLAPNQVQ